MHGQLRLRPNALSYLRLEGRLFQNTMREKHGRENGSWHPALACFSAEMTTISQPGIDLHQKSGWYFIATSKLTERLPNRRSQMMTIFTSARTLVISSTLFLLFSASAHSSDLNGAWANDPSVCDKIFVKQNAKLAMTKDADNYGSGFIVDGNQLRGKIATCNIKSRKEDAGVVNLITSCSTDVALQTVQMSFKIDSENQITRIFPGVPEMATSYTRCPM